MSAVTIKKVQGLCYNPMFAKSHPNCKAILQKRKASTSKKSVAMGKSQSQRYGSGGGVDGGSLMYALPLGVAAIVAYYYFTR